MNLRSGMNLADFRNGRSPGESRATGGKSTPRLLAVAAGTAALLVGSISLLAVSVFQPRRGEARITIQLPPAATAGPTPATLTPSATSVPVFCREWRWTANSQTCVAW